MTSFEEKKLAKWTWLGKPDKKGNLLQLQVMGLGGVVWKQLVITFFAEINTWEISELCLLEQLSCDNNCLYLAKPDNSTHLILWLRI